MKGDKGAYDPKGFPKWEFTDQYGRKWYWCGSSETLEGKSEVEEDCSKSE